MSCIKCCGIQISSVFHPCAQRIVIANNMVTVSRTSVASDAAAVKCCRASWLRCELWTLPSSAVLPRSSLSMYVSAPYKLLCTCLLSSVTIRPDGSGDNMLRKGCKTECT